MVKSKKIFILSFLILLALLTGLLCGCGGTGEETPAQTPAEEPQTADEPAEEGDAPEWYVGAEKPEAVTVKYEGGTIWVMGEGRMQDFADPADRPWNDVIADADQVSVFDEVSYIGKNAFLGAGANSEFFDVYFTDRLEEFGESAFENANFFDGCILTIPESVKIVGSKAFAGTQIGRVDFDGCPYIAADAFEGVSTEVRYLNAGGWSEENMLPYGGDLTYTKIFTFRYIEDYGAGEAAGEGSLFLPEGEEYPYNAQDNLWDDAYHFVRYELVSGSLEIAEPENPELNVVLSDDVTVKIYYEKN